MKRALSILFMALLALSSPLYAQITLPKIFGNNMVLQQGKKVAVWGKAQPNEVVTVRFQKQVKRTTADTEGRWSLKLDELTATQQPQILTIQSKSDKQVLNNVLIGEVWLASGQSNMEYSMNNHSAKYAKPKKGDPNLLQKEYEAAENNPLIRLLYIEKNLNSDSLPTQGWQENSKEALAPMSAAAYYFAKNLVDSLHVPIGIISSSWGGSAIETWMRDEGKRYKKMIQPIAPYTLKGFLWYQGESNLIYGDMDNYATKQRMLLDGWRALWSDNSLPFYYVQLAPYTYSQRRESVIKNWESLPLFWEVQSSFLTTPHTGMVVTTDLVDDVTDIHPSYKWIVGERLARLALAKDYGMNKVVYSGPTFKRMRLTPDKIIIEFDHAENQLLTSDGKDPSWFQVKEGGRGFRNVTPIIEGTTLIIERKDATVTPIVRFAWDEVAMPNLINEAGLPAVPFRTSDR